MHNLEYVVGQINASFAIMKKLLKLLVLYDLGERRNWDLHQKE